MAESDSRHARNHQYRDIDDNAFNEVHSALILIIEVVERLR
jgi:hypothetical protein